MKCLYSQARSTGHRSVQLACSWMGQACPPPPPPPFENVETLATIKCRTWDLIPCAVFQGMLAAVMLMSGILGWYGRLTHCMRGSKSFRQSGGGSSLFLFSVNLNLQMVPTVYFKETRSSYYRQQPSTTDNKPTITDDNNRQRPRSIDNKCCLT